MLPRFLKPDVVVANNAESGESLKSTLGAHRLDKVLSTMKQGDYLFIQFGHNDMKDKAADALATYKSNLEKFVKAARDKGATPVLVTSMERKDKFEQGTLGEYPETVRQVAKEQNVALIDLNAMSKTFYRALGSDLGKAFQDGTHHNNYGSYELAKCVVQGIKDSNLPVAQSIVDDFKGFDPAHPDPVSEFTMPASPTIDMAKPDGN
jgi:lysophospholipase L1-like esterase